jgi:hypothetical protein
VNLPGTDWSSVIEEALYSSKGDTSGVTCEEIMDATGKGSVLVHATLRKLYAAGRLAVNHRPAVNLRGHHYQQLVYALKGT